MIFRHHFNSHHVLFCVCTTSPRMHSGDGPSSARPAPGSQSFAAGSGPVCRVKRFANRAFRASPLVAKAASVPIIPHVCPPICGRWDQGALSLAYRPQVGGPLHIGGLTPPPRAPPAASSGSLKVGGSSTPLSSFSPWYAAYCFGWLCFPGAPQPHLSSADDGYFFSGWHL